MTEDEQQLSKEEYIELKGLRKIHDELEQRQENVRDAAESIFAEIFDSDPQDKATDAMMTLRGLDTWLENQDVEIPDLHGESDME